MKVGALARIAAAATALVLMAPWPSVAYGANCAGTSTGLLAVPDLGSGSYQGEQGGLYPGGTNDPPAAYAQTGVRAAQAVVPRDAQGRPDPGGRIVLLSIGMSNTTIEYSAFVALAQKDPLLDPRVTLVDGAQGGQDAAKWADPQSQTWSVAQDRLARAGVSAAQVQAVWLKQAQAAPRTDFETHIHSLAQQLRAIVEITAQRYPNLQQVFVSPRTYGGYATTSLNPEPYAYQAGFADKLLVAESVARPEARPWIGWGPYLWTDGTRGRSDGFVWTCDDVRASDGTHPSVPQGQMKVATLLQQFFDGSRFTGWYRASGAPSASATPLPSARPSLQPSPAPMAAPEEERSEPEQNEADWRVPAGIVVGFSGLGLGALIVKALARR